MIRSMLTMNQPAASVRAMHMSRLPLALVLPAIVLAGCVQVKAPDKPIEINLNVNIRQEVIVRLEKDVQGLIENNPGIF